MNKEEILDNYTGLFSVKYPQFVKDAVLKAMEEYAQQQLAPSSDEYYSQLTKNLGKTQPYHYQGKKCVEGCKRYPHYETKHHPGCPFYIGSLSEQYDREYAQQKACPSWVKASERLPPKEDQYFTRNKEGERGLLYYIPEEGFNGNFDEGDEWLDEQPAERAAQTDVEQKYRANFLWGFPDDSIESLGYEFANGRTEAYQKEMWNALIQKIKEKFPPDVATDDDWISVEDRLPEDLDDVIGTHIDFGCITMAYYSYEDKKWFANDRVNTDEESIITHWRPLPKPPKQ